MDEYAAGVIAARIGFSGGRSGGGSGSNEGVGEGDCDSDEDDDVDERELGDDRVASVVERHELSLASVALQFFRRVLRAPTQASRRSR